MPVPPYPCHGCGHQARPDHRMASPHKCDASGCPCLAYVYPPGVEASPFEGGGGDSGGGGSSGGW